MHAFAATPPPESPVKPAAAPRHADSHAIDCEARVPPAAPLHVALALGGTDLGRSGIGTYVREILPPLIRQLNRSGGKLTVFGHAAELHAFGPALAGAIQHRLRGVPLSASLNAAWHLFRAGRFARNRNADVLLLPAANRRSCFARGGMPTVAVIHDLAQLHIPEKYDPLRMAYFRRVLLPAFRRPDRLVAISAATRDDLINAAGVAPERIRIVYNGVNAAAFQQVIPASEAVWTLRRTLALHERPYLLYPARLEHPGKNHVRLLHAFAASGLATTHLLALSGADWGADRLVRETAARLGIEASVRHLGFVPDDQLRALVSAASAVLMLGLHEGFGLPALEGLCAGRPVCVSNTGALPEVVGPYGAQCDPYDERSIAAALLRVVNDPELRTRCAEEGPRWAQRFTWDRTAEGLLYTCREAVSARG